jgi:hypothetical protein
MSRRHLPHLLFASFCLAVVTTLVGGQEANYVAGALIRLNDNGAWSWFMDERAIVHDGKLIVGSVRSAGAFGNARDPDWGNLEIAAYDLATGSTKRVVLHRHFEQDDHNSPALLALPDNRLLAMYSKHGQERKIYYRFSEPGNPLLWGRAHEIVTPGKDGGPFKPDNVTYNNLFRLQTGRIYNFYRGERLDPNYLYSDDDGKTWTYGGRLLAGKGGYSPNLRYAFDDKKTIHFIATEDHPRNYNNGVYHSFLRDGRLHFSDGRVVAPLSRSGDAKVTAWSLTRVAAGDADNVCWIDDVRLDGEGKPRIVFSVKKDGRGRAARAAWTSASTTGTGTEPPGKRTRWLTRAGGCTPTRQTTRGWRRLTGSTPAWSTFPPTRTRSAASRS